MIALPKIALEVIERVAKYNADGFLKVITYLFQAHYEDGTKSKTFKVDNVDRNNLDAAVIIPYFYDSESKEYKIYLRSSLRPGVAVKEIRKLDDVNGKILNNGVLWEFCAGLIEPNEKPTEAAVRELKEEIGFEVLESNIKQLGHSSYPCVGLCGEELFFFTVKVNPITRVEPTLDGSVMENEAKIISLSIEECFNLYFAGSLKDMKTELGLFRFNHQMFE